MTSNNAIHRLADQPVGQKVRIVGYRLPEGPGATLSERSCVGLHGKSFVPMLSSFACAIPGIMGARVIDHPKDRLVTILVAPLVSCSARLRRTLLNGERTHLLLELPPYRRPSRSSIPLRTVKRRQLPCAKR